jgi:hypothetical protein
VLSTRKLSAVGIRYAAIHTAYQGCPEIEITVPARDANKITMEANPHVGAGTPA